MTYEERLQRLNFTTLEERRIRGNMIETDKMLTGKENIEPGKFFTMAPIRGDPDLQHNLKLFKLRPGKDTRKNFMMQSVIGGWNLLSKDVVEVEKTSTFKKRYDKWVAERRGVNDTSPFLYYIPQNIQDMKFFIPFFSKNGRALGWASTDLCANRPRCYI